MIIDFAQKNLNSKGTKQDLKPEVWKSDISKFGRSKNYVM